MSQFQRKHLPHDVPFWIDPTQEAFFLTINCEPRGRNQLARQDAWQALVETIEHREARGEWVWKLALAMPDHLHGIVTFPVQFHLRKTIADWKRWLASRHAIAWQDGFFDHRLRSEESAIEKADYIRMNPVRAGLCERPEDWEFIRVR